MKKFEMPEIKVMTVSVDERIAASKPNEVGTAYFGGVATPVWIDPQGKIIVSTKGYKAQKEWSTADKAYINPSCFM